MRGSSAPGLSAASSDTRDHDVQRLAMACCCKRMITLLPAVWLASPYVTPAACHLQGLTLRPTEHVPEKAGVVPPGATLEYELSLVRVSIPPS